MFYYFYKIYEAAWVETPLRVLRYITVRTVAAAGTAFLICLFLGPPVIEMLKKFKLGEYIRQAEAPDLFALHSGKAGTPTMGGILIILSIVVSMLIWGDLGNVNVWLAIGSLVYMGLVGFWDDYKSIINKRSKGLKARVKILLQLAWAILMVGVLYRLPETRDQVDKLMIPFFKDAVVENMHWFTVFLFVFLVVAGCTNAVNLTDGLDGLAIGCTSSAALSYLVMAYVTGHINFSEYLNIPYVKGSGELSVFCGCLAGASLGFLWFNCHPAQVFMGDTGSLALGGAIATVAVLIKQEVLLVIVGGVFVMEAVSVILQVLSFKLTGRRIFAMAPLHHHFEMKKWSETQVTIRFWILSIIFALLGILTLKIR